LAKQDYWGKNFDSSVNDTKMTWKHLNVLLNRTNDKSKFPDYFIHNGSKFSTDNEIANAFNNYFNEIGPKLASTMPLTNPDYCKFTKLI